MARRAAVAAMMLGMLTLPALPALADSKSFTLNNNTLGIMAGEPQWLPVVRALARDLNHREGLRLLPVVGEGSVQAVSDVLRLDGIDAALVPSDSIHYAEAQGLMGRDSGKVKFLARLATLKLALVTRKSVTDITALEGKRIATGPANTAGFAAGEWLFGASSIAFTRVAAAGPDALNALVRKEADAALVIGLDDVRRLPDPQNYHVLPLASPKELSDVYAPALISTEELGPLADDAKPVETVAAALVLAVFDWDARNPHSDALRRLADALMERSRRGAENGFAYNLAADVPGLARHVAAERALDEARRKSAQSQSLVEGGQP